MRALRGAWFAVLVCGCSASYTSVRRADDGSYVLTRTSHGFLGVPSAGVLRCVPASETTMKCASVGVAVDTPSR